MKTKILDWDLCNCDREGDQMRVVGFLKIPSGVLPMYARGSPLVYGTWVGDGVHLRLQHTVST